MSDVITIPVPDGYEIVDLKFQLKRKTAPIKKTPVSIERKRCDLCGGPRDNSGHDVCVKCTMRQYNDMLGQI